MGTRTTGRIFDHLDYRVYLTEHYEKSKQANPHFSFRSFSTKAGFKTKDFLYRVMHGEKNLSQASVFKLSGALNLKREEVEYFENLVKFNQSRNVKEKDFYFQRLSALRGEYMVDGSAHRLESQQYEYYAKWWHTAVRSLLDMYEFRGDFKWLAKKLDPAITTAQAEQSVALLESLGLVLRDSGGRYKATHKSLTTGTPILPLAITKFHLGTLELAARCLDEVPKEERDLSCLTLGISRKTLDRIKQKLKRFRTELLKLAEADEEADTVYHLNLHIFPLSKRDKPEGAA
ncbi:MAG: hypothetical protein JWO30_2133 [Fibrobacteres bacterium]|nr:hypothetical protein [Fibrobacterota bacterium]